MPIQTVTQRNTLVDAYKTAAAFMAVYSTVPGATAGTELTGGSPAYARRASNWGATANSAATASPAAFDIPSGATCAGIGFHTLATGGVYLDGAAVTSQTFASQGTLTVTATYTQQ
jgi:hypothetical protein